MFNNLIESRSHKREFKRRSSFLLYTITAYSFLFLVGGIASIHAYDAHLEAHEAETVIMLPAVQPELLKAVSAAQPVKANGGGATSSGSDPKNQPANHFSETLVPEKISIQPTGLKLNLFVACERCNGRGNFPNDMGSGKPQIGFPGGNGQPKATAVEIETPPPPPAVKKPLPQVLKISSVLNGRAILLPKPNYPTIAKQIRLSGQVNVQVLIDEIGKVVSAQALAGPPLLTPSAVKAAYQARFSPTLVGNTPVKVSGIISYNFVLE